MCLITVTKIKAIHFICGNSTLYRSAFDVNSSKLHIVIFDELRTPMVCSWENGQIFMI